MNEGSGGNEIMSLGRVPPYALVAEMIGTAFFQFLGGGAAVNAASTGLATAALGNGLALMVIIYATAGISGAHLNPAVTLTFWMTGRLGRRRCILYVLAQLLGAIIGALLLKWTLPPGLDPELFATKGSISATNYWNVALLEFMCTFALLYTVYATAIDARGAAKVAAPMAIGLCVAVGIFAEGPFTGGSMNPARSFGPAVAFWNFEDVWVHIFATCLGGVCGGVTYNTIFLDDVQPHHDKDRDDEPYDFWWFQNWVQGVAGGNSQQQQQQQQQPGQSGRPAHHV